MEKIKCPECKSECIRARLRTKDFVCVRCGSIFKIEKE
jgi:transcription initiation factor TFIIIB Brf1 subunit/transcription initiation factor TFIIB